eukprot:TRINITY_DN2173_c0_g1_i4.p1 TRINITY_DN2173_c0_g1~~TRINITY_DN2173_c0_g1_i4.p1  ORF type:complete len:381 (-),score=98.71 TRINITY_DN2173_c0_g1_i4:720-1793(-)
MGGRESKEKKKNGKYGAAAASGGAADIPPPAGPPPEDDLNRLLGLQPVIFSQTKQKVCADDFQLMKVVGKGSFGKVLQVRKKDDGRIYAMKILKKANIVARKQVAHTLSEKLIMQQINHPFIVKLYFAFQTEDKLYMIMDFINGGELFYHLKKEGKFSESRVKLYAAEITMALKHLHEHDIVYRDLKPENILIDYEGHIKITDFGLSKQVAQEGSTSTFCGTPEYLAPEVLKGQSHSFPVDWWSLGTLVYEMLTGLPPFYSSNHHQMYQRILSGDIHWTPDVPVPCRSLLQGVPPCQHGFFSLKKLCTSGHAKRRQHMFVPLRAARSYHFPPCSCLSKTALSATQRPKFRHTRGLTP